MLDQNTRKIDKVINIILDGIVYHINVEYSALCPLASKSGHVNNMIVCGLRFIQNKKMLHHCDPKNCPLDKNMAQEYTHVDFDKNVLIFYLAIAKQHGWVIDDRLTTEGEWGTSTTFVNQQKNKSISFRYHTTGEFITKIAYFCAGLNNGENVKIDKELL
jgi:hypothetical protein